MNPAPFLHSPRLRWIAFVIPLFAYLQAADPAQSRPLISPVFGAQMVLQRDRENLFWGWARPHEHVRFSIGGQSVTALADADGRWEVRMTPPPTAGACMLTVETEGRRIVLDDILVGDVWLCSGQSNMEFPLVDSQNGPAEVAAADQPGIRFFKVSQRASYSPTPHPEGKWQICTPSTAGESRLSAVAYFFARKIRGETGVPIGIIQAAVGGTPAEAWMSRASLQAFPEFGEQLAELDRLRASGAPHYGNFIMHWYDRYDAGSPGFAWAQPGLDDSRWKSVSVPGAFTSLGLAGAPAVVWLRREITLPNPLPQGPARILLGSVEKMDTAFLNGHWVGASAWVENPRIYTLPAPALKPGKNLLALRIFKVISSDAFLSPPETLQLELGDGSRIPLAGDKWKAAISVDARPPHPLPLGFENWPVMPTVLNRGMIEPIAPLAIRGALWYQGEANASRAWQYRSLLPALIADWRRAFREPALPFYIVSLPAFMKRRAEPGDDEWAELREAQSWTARTVPQTGLAITIDSGEADDIHPKNKKIVGERLALLALSDLYGKKEPARGPEFSNAEFLPGKVSLRFKYTDGGLVSRGEKGAGFAIAGADRKWVWADAVIEDDGVIVSSPQIPLPVAVRYAWQSNPAASLFNGAGLPAAPFRTDNWPAITETPARH
jgi:sialate O-acetylesterase